MTEAEIKYLKPRLNTKHTVITDLINIEHIKNSAHCSISTAFDCVVNEMRIDNVTFI